MHSIRYEAYIQAKQFMCLTSAKPRVKIKRK